MRIYLLTVYVLFFLIGQAQDISSLKSKIDSLKLIKQEFEQKLEQINSQIDGLERKAESMSKKMPVNENSIYCEVLKASNIYEENFSASYVLGNVNKGDTLELIDYTRNGFYQARTKEGVLGYVISFNLKDDEFYKNFRESRLYLDSLIKAEQLTQFKLKTKQEEEMRRKQIIQKYGAEKGNKILQAKIWIGMTKEMAIESWGKPNNINRTVTAFTTNEQWVYGTKYLYFENGLLTAWQD